MGAADCVAAAMAVNVLLKSQDAGGTQREEKKKDTGKHKEEPVQQGLLSSLPQSIESFGYFANPNNICLHSSPVSCSVHILLPQVI